MEKDINDYKRTFEEQEDNALLLDSIPNKFKQIVWQLIEMEIHSQSKKRGIQTARGYRRNSSLENIFFRYRFEIMGLPHDDAEYRLWDGLGASDRDKSWVKEQIFQRQDHEVLKLIEFLIRQDSCPKSLQSKIRNAFDEIPIAYMVSDFDGLPTIVPRVSLEAGAAIQRAINSVELSGMVGATSHLREAAEQIRNGQYAKSIFDSISAVVSTARTIDPNSNKSLKQALNSLEHAELLKHKALKEGFEKLYGYTSDEQGIRHPLLDRSASEVGRDEAEFMFCACAAFCAYLVSKQRAMSN